VKPSGHEIILGVACSTAFWAVVGTFATIPASMIKDLAGPVATVFAASAAAYVAFTLGRSQIAVANLQASIAKRTWQTSNEKIVLDLFERRLAIYEEIRATIMPINASGETKDDDLDRYCRSIDRVQYFFGPDVTDYLNRIRIVLINHQLACTMVSSHSTPDRHDWVYRKMEAFKEVMGFYTDAPPIFAPYIRAHQKATDDISLQG
jgi:hypothetical protein